MIPLSHHNGLTVFRGMALGAKTKTKMRLPLSTPVTNHTWGNFPDSSC